MSPHWTSDWGPSETWTQAEMARRPCDNKGRDGVVRRGAEGRGGRPAAGRGWERPGCSPRACGRAEAPRRAGFRSLASRHAGECVSVLCSQKPCGSSRTAPPHPQPPPFLPGKALSLGVTLDSPQPSCLLQADSEPPPSAHFPLFLGKHL